MVKKPKKSGVLHFTISGDFLTEHVRDRMLESGWEFAVRILVDNLHGFSYDHAIAVLSGNKKLVGKNDLNLAPENKSVKDKLTKRIDYLYAGTIFDGNHYFQPYAYVDNWGGNDLPSDCNSNIRKSENYENLRRSVRYMDNQADDNAVVLNIKDSSVVVLWKQTTSPPPWIKIYRDWQTAIDEYLKIGRKKLEHRGHLQWYGSTEVLQWYGSTEVIKESENTLQEQVVVPLLPKPDEDLSGDSGWITNDGKFYSCFYMGHDLLAKSLVYHFVNKEESNPQGRAEKMGWIKISGDINGENYLVFHDAPLALTEAQVKTLGEWLVKHKVKPPYWWEEKQPKGTK